MPTMPPPGPRRGPIRQPNRPQKSVAAITPTHRQRWREQDGRWIWDGWIEPGYAADPPQFAPLSGEVLETPAFDRNEYTTDKTSEPIDVVYTVGAGSHYGDAELRYSLRSVAQHFDNLGRVWIVGRLPDWVDESQVVYLYSEDKCVRKDTNIIRKILCASCRGDEPKLSNRFVFFSDDQILLRPLGWKQLGPYHRGDLAARKRFNSTWWKRMQHTRDVLALRGMTTLDGDTHTPLPMLRETVNTVFLGLSLEYRNAPGICVGTSYLNASQRYGHQGTILPLGDHKATIEGALPIQEIRRRIAGRWFLGYNDAGFTPDLRRLLDEMFPERCRFERAASSSNEHITVRSPAPTLSIIIPTLGRPTLTATLASIRTQQLTDGDEVILVQDGPEEEATRKVFEESGVPGKYFGLDRHYGDIGATPRNAGMAVARGDYLAFMDDDDYYLDGAFDSIRRAIARYAGRPMMFRMVRPGWAQTIWREQVVRLGNVSTQMIVTPNQSAKLGQWGPYRCGDLAFIVTTLEHWPAGSLVWCADTIAVVPQANSRDLRSATVKKNLIYHVYAHAGNDEWRSNVERLVRSWNLFTGRKIIGIVTDRETVDPETVKRSFPSDAKIEWLIQPNDPGRGEAVTWLASAQSLRSFDGLEATFYAHAKGTSPRFQGRDAAMLGSVRHWREFLYRHCLETPNDLDRLLRRYTCLGCLKDIQDFRKEQGRPPCLWHFAGTFWWINHALFFHHPDALILGTSRWALERHLGEIVPSHDAYCLAGDYRKYDAGIYHWSDAAWDAMEPKPRTPHLARI
jgi:hypothetical protein